MGFMPLNEYTALCLLSEDHFFLRGFLIFAPLRKRLVCYPALPSLTGAVVYVLLVGLLLMNGIIELNSFRGDGRAERASLLLSCAISSLGD